MLEVHKNEAMTTVRILLVQNVVNRYEKCQLE